MFALSLTVTVLQVVFKLVDTSYDMMIALIMPVFKLLPLGMCMRDGWSSAEEYRCHVMHEPGMD